MPWHNILIEGADALSELCALHNHCKSNPDFVYQVQTFTYRPDQTNLAHKASRLGYGRLLERLIRTFENVKEVEVPFDRLAGPPESLAVDNPAQQNAFKDLWKLDVLTLTNGDLTPQVETSNEDDRNLVWLMVPRLKELRLVGAALQPVFSVLKQSKCQCLSIDMLDSWDPYKARRLAKAFPFLCQLEIILPRYLSNEALRANWKRLIHHDLRRLQHLRTLELDFPESDTGGGVTDTKRFGKLSKVSRLSLPVALLEMQEPSEQLNAGQLIKDMFPSTLVYLKLYISHAFDFRTLAHMLRLMIEAGDVVGSHLSNLLEIRIECNEECGLRDAFMNDDADSREQLKEMGVEGVDAIWTDIKALRDLNEDEPIEVVTDFAPGFLSDDEARDDLVQSSG